MKKKRIMIGLCVVVALCVIGGVVFYFTRSYDYDYSHLIKRYSAPQTAEKTAFAPLTGGEAPAKRGEMDLALESDTLAFYMDALTAEFAVVDKRNDTVWRSNPEDIAADMNANRFEQESMASQFMVRYYNDQRKTAEFVSYVESVARGQFVISRVEDAVQVEYTLGRLELGADIMPKYLSKERLDEILDRITDSAAKKEVRGSYAPSKTKNEEFGNEEGIVFYEMADSIKEKTGPRLNRLMKGFEEAGYTEEELAMDNETARYEMSLAREFIRIVLEYRLIGDSLQVTVPCDQIETSEAISVGYIELLKYFGAGGLNDEGYLFVPAGSGGLIHFNNGKIRDDSYEQAVYGLDPLLSTYTTQNMYGARMPVFGIHKNGAGMVALIQSGDGLSTVYADISGRVNSVNVVYAGYKLKDQDTMLLASANDSVSEMTVIQDRIFQGDISVLYSFLDIGQGSYSHMASYIRDRYVAENRFTALTQTAANPLYLSVIGAQEKQKRLVGIPYDAYETMTTYREAAQIIADLAANGVSHINLRMLGWFNKGVNHDVAKQVSLIGGLGSRKDLQALNTQLAALGGYLFPDVQFLRVAYTTGNYNTRAESARWLNGFTANDVERSRLFLRPGGVHMTNDYAYRINSPRVVPTHVESFLKAFDKLNLSGVSLRDLGSYLATDQNRDAVIDRETAKLIAVEQIQQVAEHYDRVLVNESNLYAFDGATDIVGVPMSGDRFYLIDEEVPFMQMILHGYVDYAGTPVNTSDTYDYNTTLLKMLEYGASPHYIITQAETVLLAETANQKYYSTQFDIWRDVIINQYAVVNAVNNPVRHSAMVGHVRHDTGVYETIYDNGVSVYVNYTETAANVNGVTVPPQGYAVGGGQ